MSSRLDGFSTEMMIGLGETGELHQLHGGMAHIKVQPSAGHKKTTECHVVPCKIHYTGPANVSQYFSPEQRENGRVAYFRGRHLLAHDVNLSNGYHGKSQSNHLTLCCIRAKLAAKCSSSRSTLGLRRRTALNSKPSAK